MYYLPIKPVCTLPVDALYTVHYFEYHKDFVFAGEQHDFWELMYVDKGEIIVSSGEKFFSLKQNQLTVFAPGEFHALRTNGMTAPNTLIVSFASSCSALYDLAGRSFLINEYARSLLAGILREATGIYENDLSDPSYRQLVRRPVAGAFAAEQLLCCNLQLLLIELIREGGFQRSHLPSSTTTANDRRQRFKALSVWIETHIDRTFTIEMLCAQAMVNKPVLEQLFHKHAGVSAIRYCRQRKIEKAKKMIREDTMNMSQISEYLGFSSVHYFSRTFRQIEHVSPSEYAKSVKAIVDHSLLVKEPDSQIDE